MKTDSLALIVFCVLFIAIVVVALRENLFHDINDMSKAVAVGKHNIDYQFFPARRKPLILSTKEMTLRQFHPDFFKKFDKNEWREFWDIIYGQHPLIEFKSEKLERADRSLYLQEIQAVLIDRYPEGFVNFSQEMWSQFWMQIFDITPGVPANLLQEDNKQKELAERRLKRIMERDDARVSEGIQKAAEIDELK